MEGNYKASCLGGHVFQRRWAALGLFHGRRLLPMLISAKCWCGEIFFCSKNISHPSFIIIFLQLLPILGKGPMECLYRIFVNRNDKFPPSPGHPALLSISRPSSRRRAHNIDLFTPKKKHPERLMLGDWRVKRGPPAHQGSTYKRLYM